MPYMSNGPEAKISQTKLWKSVTSVEVLYSIPKHYKDFPVIFLALQPEIQKLV